MNAPLRSLVRISLRVDSDGPPSQNARLDQESAMARRLLAEYGVDVDDPTTAQTIVALTAVLMGVYTKAARLCDCERHKDLGHAAMNGVLLGLSHDCAHRLNDIEQGGN